MAGFLFQHFAGRGFGGLASRQLSIRKSETKHCKAFTAIVQGAAIALSTREPDFKRKGIHGRSPLKRKNGEHIISFAVSNGLCSDTG